VLSLLVAGRARAEVAVTGDHRLLLHFVEDGALVSKGWIEAAGTYARVDGGSDIGADLRAAFRFGRNVEAGLTARALMRSRDAGRTSGLLGFGLLVPLSYEWTFLAEVNYEGARFKDQGQDIEALAGMDWRPAENIVVRGGMGAGLTDAAPSVLAVLSAAFHF